MFNDSHQDLLCTDVNRNPTITKRHGFVVRSIFKRRKSNDNKNDGNPLIYALKRKDGYTISRTEVGKFLAHFYAILEKALADSEYDVIVPLPSAHPLNTVIARRVGRMLPNAEMRADLFEKKTTGQVMDEIDPLDMPTRGIKKNAKKLKRELRRMPPNRSFSMKNVVNHRLRTHINPLNLVGSLEEHDAPRVLLVDDLFSSGATIEGGRKLLKGIDNMARIEGLCLFSKL